MNNELSEIDAALKTLESTKTQTGPGHPDLVSILVTISKLYQQQKQYTNAYSYHIEAIDILTVHLTEIHPHLFEYYCDIIELESKLEMVKEVFEHWKKALIIVQYFPDTELDRFLKISFQIGINFRYGYMSKYYTKCIELIIKRKANDSKELLPFYKELILLGFHFSPKFSEFINYTAEFLRVSLLYHKELSIEVADAYRLFARSQLYHNKNKEAVLIYEKAMDIFPLVLEEKSAEIVEVYRAAAGFYSVLNQTQKSIDWRLKALSISEKLLGGENRELIKEYAKLYLAYLNLRDYASCIKFRLKVKKYNSTKKDNSDLLGIAYSCIDLANLYLKNKDYVEAIITYKLAIKSVSKLKDNSGDSPSGKQNFIALSLAGMAKVHYERKEYHKAIKLWKSVIDIRIRFIDETELVDNNNKYYEKLAYSYLFLEDYGHSVEYWKKTIAAHEISPLRKNTQVYAFYQNLSACYFYLNQFEKSLKAIQKAVNISEEYHSDNLTLIESVKKAEQVLIDCIEYNNR